MIVRGAVSSLLVLLACALAVAVVPVRWLDAQLHTDDYAETVRPLPRDPAVQRAITDRLTDAIESSGQDVPPEVANTVESKVPVVLDTPEATEAWVAANMAARDALLAGTDGKVTVDIDELIETLSDRLRAEGVEVPAELPEHASSVVLVDSPSVARARDGSELTATLAQALPFAAGVLLVLALLISARRLRTLALAGIGVSALTVVEILALQLGRDRYLATVDDATSRALLDAVAQGFSRSLRSDLLGMLLAALAVAVGAIILGILTRRRGRRGDDLDGEPDLATIPGNRPDDGWPDDGRPDGGRPDDGRPGQAARPGPYAEPPRYAEAPQPRYAAARQPRREPPPRYAERPPAHAERPRYAEPPAHAEHPPRQPPGRPDR
ncbi:MAG: hypothetical protein ACRDP8_25480 [Actinopolymorphaceae bacterium]